MKIQIDTNKKIIRVESNVKFKYLIKNLDKMFPKKEWEEFILETDVIINNWTQPVYIKKLDWPNWPSYPWYCENTSIDGVSTNTVDTYMKINNGVFCIEC